MYTQLFHAVALCAHSKEESGFMAVPLVDKGVVVVAVGYDIAPKGESLYISGELVSVLKQGGKPGSFKEMNW